MNPFLIRELGYLLPFLAVAGAFGIVHRLTRPGVLNYQDAISYFVTHRPMDHNVVRGAILLEKADGETTTVRWLFLDRNNEPVVDASGALYGRSRRYATLSQELLDEFQGTDLLVVS